MTITLYLQDKDCKWLTGQIVKSRDPLGGGNTKWEVSWEGGDFVFYGTKPEMKRELKKKRKSKIVKLPTGSASRHPRRLPRLCFRFRLFEFHSLPPPQPRC